MSHQSLRSFLLEVLQQEASKITEPKRSGLSVDQLGLESHGGVKNIIKVYNQATPEEKDYWGRWYHNAKTDVQELAVQFNLPFPVVAGIVAVLSPGNKWSMNLLAAERLLQGQSKINAYPRQVQRAQRILETGDIGLVSGPKVTVFFNSLVDPKMVEKDMVLDGHAINIWRGEKVSLKNLTYPNSKERTQMIQDYQTAAKELGVPVQAVQAVTWYIWKYTGKTAPLEAPTSVYDVSKFRNVQPANDVMQENKARKIKKWFHVTEQKFVPTILANGFEPGNGSAGLGTYLWETIEMAWDWIDGNRRNYQDPVILAVFTSRIPEHVAEMDHIDPDDADQYQGHFVVSHKGTWKPERIEVVDDSLDEVNAVGAGLVVGSGMGNGGTDASKKLLWSGDEPLKEFIDKVVENVLDKMQQKHVGGAPRKSPYGDTYVGFSSGSEEDASGRDKQAGIVKKVNKNLNKKPYTLHDPPSMGISITRPSLKDRK